jgi:glycosyltransferase involved in cell wall biosynthesis
VSGEEDSVSVCFFGSVPYEVPLDPTSAKKFEALRALGRVVVIAFSTGLARRDFVESARFRLLPWLSSPLARYAVLFTWGCALLFREALRKGSRVLVAQSPYEGVGAAMVKVAARLLGRRPALVVESHGDFEEAPFLQKRFLLPALWRFAIRRASRFSLRHADALRAISGPTRRQLESWAPGKPLVQFATWTDIDPFLEEGARSRERGSERFFLYAGVLTRLKAVDVLLAAFAKIEDRTSRLVVIGRAEDPAYAQELEEDARALAISDRVDFLPAQPQRELARTMSRARALVLPSLSEGLGRVVLEAMTCRTPVIGSRVGGIVDLISPDETGFLVPPGDADALAERMTWVLDHPAEADAMGERAREHALRFFSTESYVLGYRRLIEEALRS